MQLDQSDVWLEVSCPVSSHQTTTNDRQATTRQTTTNDQADLGGQVTTNVTRQPVIAITKLLQ